MRDNHHRLPRAQGGTRKRPKGNVARVPRYEHAAFHAIWDGTKTLEEIVADLNNRWIDPRYKLVIKERR